MAGGDAAGAIELLQTTLDGPVDPEQAMRGLVGHLRYVCLLQQGARPRDEWAFSPEEVARLQAQANQLPTPRSCAASTCWPTRRCASATAAPTRGCSSSWWRPASAGRPSTRAPPRWPPGSRPSRPAAPHRRAGCGRSAATAAPHGRASSSRPRRQPTPPVAELGRSSRRPRRRRAGSEPMPPPTSSTSRGSGRRCSTCSSARRRPRAGFLDGSRPAGRRAAARGDRHQPDARRHARRPEHRERVRTP